MSDKAFDINEFIEAPPPPPSPEAEGVEVEEVEVEELDVQKAVVEALASEKAELDESLSAREAEIASLKEKVEKLEADIAASAEREAQKERECAEREACLSKKLEELQEALNAEMSKSARLDRELSERLEKEFEQEERNPNALALIDRNVDIPDRFPGETRDHVLEAIKAARDKAEAEGRFRCAKILEGVLAENEPNGGLAKRRENMRKLFEVNGNLVNGPVINILQKFGIAYREGEKYLMPSEIINRTY